MTMTTHVTPTPELELLWFDVRGVARALGISVETVYRIEASELPYVKLTGKGIRRYRPRDVEAYIEAHFVRG